jgi:phenylalanyl-tRNA synthetase beta chain
MRRFINLVSEYSNIKNMSFVSYKFEDITAHKIPVNVNKVNQIIGIDISEDEYLRYLLKLGFTIDNALITVPSYRSDIETQNDLAEEVARAIGYNNIPKKELSIPKGKISNNYDIENKLRFFLLDQGFYEVINSPFVNSDSDVSIKVDNPLDSNREYLRTNITRSLLDNLIFNERRQKDSIKLFEISDVYTSKDNQIYRIRKLSIIASGRAGHNYEDFSKKINIKYLTKLFKKGLPSENFNFQILDRDSTKTKIKNQIIGCEVDISNFSTEVLNYKEISKSPDNFIQYSPISELPYSQRDISFSIKDHTKCKPLEKFVLEYDDELLKKVFLFDYFYNKKNAEIKIGFRFIFQSTNTTITETQVNNIMRVIIEHAKKIDGISIPGLN